MPGKEKPGARAAAAGVGNLHLDDDTAEHAGASSEGLDRIGSALAAGLRVLPAAGEAGHRSLGEIAAGPAAILRARLGPSERLTGRVA